MESVVGQRTTHIRDELARQPEPHEQAAATTTVSGNAASPDNARQYASTRSTWLR
jgi:hypothetical protein